jgi:hypothetical protein
MLATLLFYQENLILACYFNQQKIAQFQHFYAENISKEQ